MMRLILAALIVLSCEGCKKQNNDFECQQFKHALNQNDESIIKQQLTVTSMTVGRLPAQAGFAETKETLQRLVDLLNKQCDVNAELVCTQCVYTLPPLSEIRLRSFFNNISRIIDVQAEPGKYITPVAMHE